MTLWLMGTTDKIEINHIIFQTHITCFGRRWQAGDVKIFIRINNHQRK